MLQQAALCPCCAIANALLGVWIVLKLYLVEARGNDSLKRGRVARIYWNGMKEGMKMAGARNDCGVGIFCGAMATGVMSHFGDKEGFGIWVQHEIITWG